YCCGISQPPKSTIRPPRATCLSYRGVRFVSLLAVDGVVEVDRVRIDERQELLVVASSGVGDDLGHVSSAVHRPLQLFRELVLCRCPVQLTMQQQLRSLVVFGAASTRPSEPSWTRSGTERPLCWRPSARRITMPRLAATNLSRLARSPSADFSSSRSCSPGSIEAVVLACCRRSRITSSSPSGGTGCAPIASLLRGAWSGPGRPHPNAWG